MKSRQKLDETIDSMSKEFLKCPIFGQCIWSGQRIYESRPEKTNNMVFELVRHKPACTNTKNGWRLEMLDLKSREIVLSV